MRKAIELGEDNLAEAIVEWGRSRGWQIDEDSIFIQQDSGDTFAYASLIEPIEPGCEEEEEEGEYCNDEEESFAPKGNFELRLNRIEKYIQLQRAKDEAKWVVPRD